MDSTETRVLYALHYSLVLHFKEEDKVEGQLCPIDEYNIGVHTFTGIQCCENGSRRIAFFLDWSFKGDPYQGFSSFVCELVNPDVAIINWLLVDNEHNSNPPDGTDFLYSEELFSKRYITPVAATPFPRRRVLNDIQI